MFPSIDDPQLHARLRRLDADLDRALAAASARWWEGTLAAEAPAAPSCCSCATPAAAGWSPATAGCCAPRAASKPPIWTAAGSRPLAARPGCASRSLAAAIAPCWSIPRR